jgi:ATP-binding cassette subfamily B protein
MLVMVLTGMAGVIAAIIVPLVTKRVIDGPIAHHARHHVLPLVGLSLLMGLSEATLAFVRRWEQSTVGCGVEEAMRNDLYAHLQRLPVAFHDQWQSGQLLSRAMADLSTIRRFVGFGLVFLVLNMTTFAVVITLLLGLHAGLGLLTLAMAVPLLFGCMQFERRYAVVARRVQDQGGDLTTAVEEAAAGIRVIKAFGRGGLMRDGFAARARAVQQSSLDQVALRAYFWSLLDYIPSLTLAAVLLFGALAVGHGTLTLGGLVAFVTLVLMLVWPVEALGWILATGQEAATAAQRVFEILDTEPAIADRPNAFVLPSCRGEVRFDNVSFRYPGTNRWVLRGIDLTLEPGETLALVGATGCGKTTLATLLPRLYDVTDGGVCLDGHDIRDLHLASLRSHVGVAFEDPVLFSASVRENLLLGHAGASQDDVLVALHTAQAQFALDLPWGLDTRIGEQGLSLSGGQRQRLALARAIIGRPRVLVLDDPLSALDVQTEALVEEALARVLAGTTAVVVVHRPSTVALADRVAFLDAGRIAAIGTHSHLMDSVPEYRRVLTADTERDTDADATQREEVA